MAKPFFPLLEAIQRGDVGLLFPRPVNVVYNGSPRPPRPSSPRMIVPPPLATDAAPPPAAPPTAVWSDVPERAADPETRPAGWLGARAALDGLTCLAVAVLMLRVFLVEGYMISTGSMAPTLYGYHKRAICPACGEAFARGVAFDASGAYADDDSGAAGDRAVCPNCGLGSIDLSEVPRNHGDQLLVMKGAYDLRPPRRWEVVVFRNPARPTQAFVKRTAGLPGEAVQVIGGDLYADGAICRKSLETQRAMRIGVFDAAHQPAPRDPALGIDWRPRWEPGPGWSADTRSAGAFRLLGTTDANATPADGLAYLRYRHVVRSGGQHRTAMPLAALPPGVMLPTGPFAPPVRFDPGTPPLGSQPTAPDADTPDDSPTPGGRLIAVGVLTAEHRRVLLDLAENPTWRAAVSGLAARSHAAPISDAYAYNRGPAAGDHAVRDVMLSTRVRLSGAGRFAVELTDGRDAFRVTLDTRPTADGSGAGMMTLSRIETGEVLREAALPAGFTQSGGALLEVSVMDRQVMSAADGELPFAAWTYDEPPRRGRATAVPLQLGAAGGPGFAATASELAVYRDVFYTRGKSRHGIDEPFALGPDEFFMLGDNSPVSLDSRSWGDGALPARMLLGKPFVVHLPSRPATLRLGSRRLTVRVPDFGRVRYIR